MKLICCLGNPGQDYAHTRHNVGFDVGEAFLKQHNFEKVGKKFKSILYKGRIGTEIVFLMFPQTFMNLSGEAVQAFFGFYKLTPEDLLVVFDELDINFGTLRMKAKGSGGTHNGMKNIIQLLGSNNFARLRVGIGPKPEGWPLTNFVLGKFGTEETTQLPDIITKSIKAIEDWIKEDINIAMKNCNTL